ncbi:MAG TPA: sigma-54-dependent Fis family transcriptional regulator [Methylomirabilota bacterium]|nr:sigma-54-dependent Fis family transcriptional regulator [Methylomirabilota bacterium]
MASKETFSTFPHPDQERRVMAAWEQFLGRHDMPLHAVRDVIEGSWERCTSSGVDPGRSQAAMPLPEEALRALQHAHRDLIGASASITEQARDFLAQSGTFMILTDPTGVILETVGDAGTVERARKIRLETGAAWDERACGTNAIGTALALRGPVQVHGAEHFCSGIKPWTCSATVICDPIHGEVIGVLDVSGPRDSFSRHSLALAVITAGRIEGEVARRTMELRHHLLQAGPGRPSAGGLVFFDRKGRLVEVDPHAARSLRTMGVELESGPGQRVDALDLDTTRALGAGRARLPEWLKPEWVEPIRRGGEQLGTIVVLPEPVRWGRARRGGLARVTTRGIGIDPSGSGQIVGSSALLRQALEKAKVLAEVDVPVLLLGETGVGKEQFARALHDGGPRTDRPFVAVNCGGLPRELLASELFGYVDGAFTGARHSGMVGKIESASGGTLFLDEIGEMPLELQPYLLRVLEGGEVYPLGGAKPRMVEFRLVAATNKDLRAEVAAHRFRSDLFYRISVTSLHIPALRERREDIPALVEHFSRDVALRHGARLKQFEPEALSALGRYTWPGNIRELRNVVEGAVLMATGEAVTVSDLPPDLTTSLEEAPAKASAPTSASTVVDLEAVERAAISAAIVACQGNLTLVAKELRISKSTLYLKVKKYGLDKLVPDARVSAR